MKDAWHLAGRNLQSPVSVYPFRKHATIWDGNGDTILWGSQYNSNAEVGVDELKKPAGFPRPSFNQFYNRIQSYFQIEKDPIDEESRVH